MSGSEKNKSEQEYKKEIFGVSTYHNSWKFRVLVVQKGIVIVQN